MPRGRKPAEKADEEPVVGAADTSAEQEPVGEQLPSEPTRQREPGDNDALMLADGASAVSHADRASADGERRPLKFKDPRSEASVEMTSDRHGPRMRVLRQNRWHEEHKRPASMWIQFDEKPDDAILDQLRSAGYRFDRRALFVEEDSGREHRGAWIKPLERGREWRVRAEAHELFPKLANQHLESRGLPATAVMQGASQAV